MNICLLKCGSIYESFKNRFVDYDIMFINSFRESAVDINFEVFEVHKDIYPSNLTKYDGFLSSGSLSSVYHNDPWITKYQKFIVELFQKKQKHVGICFGHQMIAHALGGKVEKAKQGWGMGIKRATIKKYTSWMDGFLNDGFNLIVSHQDQVVKLPENSTILAGNDHCPFSMFTVTKYFLGIQAHPEFTKDYHLATIDLRSKKVDPLIIKNAKKTLSQPTDEKLIIHWIENFFRETN